MRTLLLFRRRWTAERSRPRVRFSLTASADALAVVSTVSGCTLHSVVRHVLRAAHTGVARVPLQVKRSLVNDLYVMAVALQHLHTRDASDSGAQCRPVQNSVMCSHMGCSKAEHPPWRTPLLMLRPPCFSRCRAGHKRRPGALECMEIMKYTLCSADAGHERHF